MSKFIFIVLTCALPIGAHAQSAVTITDIQQDAMIEGTINYPGAKAEDHCVVVYVRTDIWYLHPYATGGEDQSWAAISDKKWSIATVKRKDAARGVAALLLKKDRSGECPAPAKRDNPAGIPRQVGTPFIKTLSTGDAWYGRL